MAKEEKKYYSRKELYTILGISQSTLDRYSKDTNSIFYIRRINMPGRRVAFSAGILRDLEAKSNSDKGNVSEAKNGFNPNR